MLHFHVDVFVGTADDPFVGATFRSLLTAPIPVVPRCRSTTPGVAAVASLTTAVAIGLSSQDSGHGTHSSEPKRVAAALPSQGSQPVARGAGCAKPRGHWRQVTWPGSAWNSPGKQSWLLERLSPECGGHGRCMVERWWNRTTSSVTLEDAGEL